MTVREWFRAWRREYRPNTEAEQNAVIALRLHDWRVAEFWALQHLSDVYRDAQGVHHWRLMPDGYFWECARCGAKVASVEINERGPDPELFDAGCECKACQPCKGQP